MNEIVVPVMEPGIQVPIPIGEPYLGGLPERAEFAFPKPLRDWYMRVANFQCQTFIYSEAEGYHICGEEAEEVDHIKPEAWLLENGEEDPNNTVGIPRCRKHHTGGGYIQDDGEVRLALYGEPGWSRHPDMGKARAEYHPTKNPNTFKRAAEKHIEMAREGIIFWNSDPGVDEFESQHMQDLISIHNILHPEDPQPVVREHKKFKKKSWMDN